MFTRAYVTNSLKKIAFIHLYVKLTVKILPRQDMLIMINIAIFGAQNHERIAGALN